MDSDLSFTDIRFLRKVRDINSNPEAYERTEKGKVPASTGAILKASDLTESEVRYRMGGSRCRGLEGAGLTVVHEAEFDEETKTFGAKSVELTQEGMGVLTDFEEENDVFDDGDAEDTPEVVKQLRGRVNKLEQQSMGGGSGSIDVDREIRSLRNDIDRIERELDSIQDDPWGAVDTQAVSHVKDTIKQNQAMFYIFQSVFGIDVERRVEDGEYPSASAIEAERVDLFELLSSAGYSGTGGGSLQNPNQGKKQNQDGGQVTTSDSVGGRESTSQEASMEERVDVSEGDRSRTGSEIVDENGDVGEGESNSIPEHEPPSFLDTDDHGEDEK